MGSYEFAKIPSNSSVAFLVSAVVSTWFAVASGVLLAEPSVGERARALQAKTPVVTVKQLSARQDLAPEARPAIEVAAKRGAGGVS